MKRNSLLLALLTAFVSVSAQSIRENFVHPPKGYGEVPFFWWNGDTLMRKRLSYDMVALDEQTQAVPQSSPVSGGSSGTGSLLNAPNVAWGLVGVGTALLPFPYALLAPHETLAPLCRAHVLPALTGSLQQADICDSRLVSGDESYRTLVLVDAKAMHEETRRKIETFMRQGGHVITVGESIIPDAQHIDDYRQLPQVICKAKQPDFSSSGHAARVLHRQADGHDIYMVMEAAPGDTLFFRATGLCEQWNAFDGSQTVCRLLRQSKEGSWLLFDGEQGQSRLYVFTEGQPHPIIGPSPKMERESEREVITLDGLWQTTLTPTMDNRFGDFRLPASNEIIGAEAREFTASFVPKGSNIAATQMTSVYGYAPSISRPPLTGMCLATESTPPSLTA